MTQDEIIEMPQYLNAAYEGDDLYTGDQVRELMKLVAAKEREACADLAETYFDPMWQEENEAAKIIGEAIRARGEA